MRYRTLCDVLEEMRKAHETTNFSYLMGLIQEAQTMGNRMEAALWDQKDFKRAETKYKKLKKTIESMEKDIEEKVAKDDEKI